ncbi:MAG: flagellar basal body-associated FliL family protein [Desulfovibrionaceae bacterium]
MVEELEMKKTPEKKGNKKILIFILIILIASAATGAWFFFMQDKNVDPKIESVGTAEKVDPEQFVTVEVPPFLVNLADPLGRRFIKLTLKVEVKNQQVAKILEKNMFQIRDKIILLLSSKTYADLAPLDNKIYLKNEIVERINQVITPETVQQIFFTDMIIQ